MFCTYCGGELREGAEFCTKCGQRVIVPKPVPEQRGAKTDYAEPLQIRCISCGEVIGDDLHKVNNCPYCGRGQGLNIAVDPGSAKVGYTGQTVMPGNYGVGYNNGYGSGGGGNAPEVYGGTNKEKNRKLALVTIAAAAFLIAAVCFIIAGISSVADEFGHEEIIWPRSGLSQMIPEIGELGEIYRDGSDYFSVEIYNISKSDYADYAEQCRSGGFDVDAVKDYDSFYAYNAEGCKLTLDYYEYGNRLSIRLTAPIAMRKIKPADNGLGGLLPELPSDMGYIESETESYMDLYLGEVTREQYDEFVTACIQNGFNEEYSRGGDYFYGSNGGVSLTVEYVGNNTIEIMLND